MRAAARSTASRLRADEHRYDIGNFQPTFRAFVEFALEDVQQGRP